ncbi:MAG: PD40 domain-containing protein [Bacteroidia bacterium]|nr:PD40 domain-containing protein [Bacteroidia bacterium]
MIFQKPHRLIACAIVMFSVNIALPVVPDSTIHYPQERHLNNIRQLTFGGDNAEAYFSFSQNGIVFQATNPAWNASCDQIFYSRLDSFQPVLVSTGKGRTTCSYFLPGDSTFLYASTHESGDACPPKPAPRADHKYVWPVYDSFDIYVADLKGKILKKLTDSPGYDAEATVSPKGDRIVFTSMRNGDLELYTMKIDGSDVKQITHELGYDGGAFFSPDGTRLVFRASRPKSAEEIQVYKDLLSQHEVMPTNMELFVCNADGSDLKQVTHLGGANWAPFFSPDGKKIIFSSNHITRGFHFNLWMCNLDGTGLEQITFDPVFDAFPVFSPDGTKLIFSSNRNNGGTHNTNLFIADWKP